MNRNTASVRRALRGACLCAVVLATMFLAASPSFAQMPSITGVTIAYGSTNTITIIGSAAGGVAPGGGGGAATSSGTGGPGASGRVVIFY